MSPDDNDQPLPASDAGIAGGTNGAIDGASMADLQRGYTKPMQAPAPLPYEPMFFDGDDDESQELQGGFLGRPEGWER